MFIGSPSATVWAKRKGFNQFVPTHGPILKSSHASFWGDIQLFICNLLATNETEFCWRCQKSSTWRAFISTINSPTTFMTKFCLWRENPLTASRTLHSVRKKTAGRWKHCIQYTVLVNIMHFVNIMQSFDNSKAIHENILYVFCIEIRKYSSNMESQMIHTHHAISCHAVSKWSYIFNSELV